MMSILRKMILRHLILCNIAFATAKSGPKSPNKKSPKLDDKESIDSSSEQSIDTASKSSYLSYGEYLMEEKITCDYNKNNHKLTLEVDLEEVDDEESYLNAIDLSAKLNLKGIIQSAA